MVFAGVRFTGAAASRTVFDVQPIAAAWLRQTDSPRPCFCRAVRPRWLRAGAASSLEPQLVPLHGILFRISPGVAGHLASLLERSQRRFQGYRERRRPRHRHRARPGTRAPAGGGKPRLEDRAFFMDLVGGQRLRIHRADPSSVRDHQVRDQVVQMVVGIAGDRRVPIGSPRPGRFWTAGSAGPRHERTSPSRSRRARSLSRPHAPSLDAELSRGVAERIVARGMDGVADHRLVFGRRDSAASDTDLWGATTKSKRDFFRTCSLQSAPLLARRASKRASSSSSRGSARTLATPGAAADAPQHLRAPVRQLRPGPPVSSALKRLQNFQGHDPSVEKPKSTFDVFRLGLVLGALGRGSHAPSLSPQTQPRVEHVRLVRRRSRVRRWRRRRRLGRGG